LLVASIVVLSCIGLMCVFDGMFLYDLDGSVVSYVWDFGDGGIVLMVIFLYVYVVGGMYLVGFIVIDDKGVIGLISILVIVIVLGVLFVLDVFNCIVI